MVFYALSIILWRINELKFIITILIIFNFCCIVSLFYIYNDLRKRIEDNEKKYRITAEFMAYYFDKKGIFPKWQITKK